MPLRASKPKGLVMTLSWGLWRESPYPCRCPLATPNPWQAKLRIAVTADNVMDIAHAGRGRWKSANENNNVLKTKGYHLEHNFGHGKQYLSAFLLSLNLLAFLFHTV